MGSGRCEGIGWLVVDESLGKGVEVETDVEVIVKPMEGAVNAEEVMRNGTEGREVMREWLRKAREWEVEINDTFSEVRHNSLSSRYLPLIPAKIFS